MNGLCESPLCPRISSEVRLIPIDRSYTACLCQECYDNEMDYSNELQSQGLPRLLPQKEFGEYKLLSSDPVFCEAVESWV
jgi:hypothetical protein